MKRFAFAFTQAGRASERVRVGKGILKQLCSCFNRPLVWVCVSVVCILRSYLVL